MKITIISLSVLLFTSMIVRAADSVTKIDKLPYTITAPGNYEVTKDLTVASDKNAISVNAPRGTYVVINLGGFSITARSAGGTGIGVSSSPGNTVVYNGTISGFQVGVELDDGGKACDLQLLGNLNGIFVGSNDTVVQNCYIIGTGPANSGDGIFIENCADVQVSGCHISQFGEGINSFGGKLGNAFLHNYIAGCTNGLELFTNDYYQGNVVTNCTTPFTGGNAIGTENGGY
jgi:nitrous oxidase accessory protein NosD